jgi:GNAT superfamily N-acetyltransferase
MEVSPAQLPKDTSEIVDFVVARIPEQDRTILRSDLDGESARSLRAYVSYQRRDMLAGVSLVRTASNLPDGAAYVMVCTRADLGGRGLGSALFAAVLSDLGEHVTRLVTCVLEDDHRSMSVARHWGFQEMQSSVTTSVDLFGARVPDPIAGVTFEECADLVFDDEEAVGTMLLASQTNPEFDLGLVLELSSLRETPAPGQRPIAVLTRVGGRPAALSFAVADGDQMHVVYTGVDPGSRGRRLALFTKQALHAHAREQGIRTALTENEESNTGIRRVNDQLGYARHSSWSWMMRPRP